MHCPGSWGTVEDDSRLRTVATCVACSEPSIPLPVRVQGSDCRSVARSVTDRERASLPQMGTNWVQKIRVSSGNTRWCSLHVWEVPVDVLARRRKTRAA